MTDKTNDAAGSWQRIEVEGLSMRTAMGAVYNDVNLSVNRGQVCCIYGDRGSGKTAFLLSVCGRMKYNKGTIRVDGEAAKPARMRAGSAISFIPEVNAVQPFLEIKHIMAAELALNGVRGNKANTDAYFEKWGFFDLKEVRFKELDSYDAARFGVILAMASNPELLIVDDVQADLTQHQSRKLVAWLKGIAAEYGTTVLFACTEYEIARRADGVVVMSEGAEAQRRAVLRDENLSLSDAIPVFGYGNGVNIDLDKPEGSFMRRAVL